MEFNQSCPSLPACPQWVNDECPEGVRGKGQDEGKATRYDFTVPPTSGLAQTLVITCQLFPSSS